MSQERMDCVPLIGLTKLNVCVCLTRGWIVIPLIGLPKSNVCACLKRGWFDLVKPINGIAIHPLLRHTHTFDLVKPINGITIQAYTCYSNQTDVYTCNTMTKSREQLNTFYIDNNID
jgi:hypothetical protein